MKKIFAISCVISSYNLLGVNTPSAFRDTSNRCIQVSENEYYAVPEHYTKFYKDNHKRKIEEKKPKLSKIKSTRIEKYVGNRLITLNENEALFIDGRLVYHSPNKPNSTLIQTLRYAMNEASVDGKKLNLKGLNDKLIPVQLKADYIEGTDILSLFDYILNPIYSFNDHKLDKLITAVKKQLPDFEFNKEYNFKNHKLCLNDKIQLEVDGKPYNFLYTKSSQKTVITIAMLLQHPLHRVYWKDICRNTNRLSKANAAGCVTRLNTTFALCQNIRFLCNNARGTPTISLKVLDI